MCFKNICIFPFVFHPTWEGWNFYSILYSLREWHGCMGSVNGGMYLGSMLQQGISIGWTLSKLGSRLVSSQIVYDCSFFKDAFLFDVLSSLLFGKDNAHIVHIFHSSDTWIYPPITLCLSLSHHNTHYSSLSSTLVFTLQFLFHSSLSIYLLSPENYHNIHLPNSYCHILLSLYQEITLLWHHNFRWFTNPTSVLFP